MVYPRRMTALPFTHFRLFKTTVLGFLLITVLMHGGGTCEASALNAGERQIADRLVSDFGQRRDRSRMRPDPILSAVARARAEDMAKRRYFSHVNPDGKGPNYLVRSAGYTLPPSWNGRSSNFIESIGAGYPTAQAAWEGWMRSFSHRTHLLASRSFYRDQTNFGVGSYADPSSPYRVYWVVITAPPPREETEYMVGRSSTPVRIASSATLARSGLSQKKAAPALQSSARTESSRPRSASTLWDWESAQIIPPRNVR